MEYLNSFIISELLILIPVLYLMGMGIKKSKWIDDKYIPIILGAVGVILSCLYVKGVNFVAITQGILCAGCSVYVNQIIKQGTQR